MGSFYEETIEHRGSSSRRARHSVALENAARRSEAAAIVNGGVSEDSIQRQVSLDAQPPHQIDAQLLKDLEERTAGIQRRATTQPFILVLEFSGDWGPVVSFVELSRQKHLPFRMPIVVLCPEPPDPEREASLQLRKDPWLAFVWGSPHNVRDLIRAGVHDCSIIIGLSESVGQTNSEMAAMLDSDVVMIYRMLENLSKGKTNMIFQFNRTNSMWLLPVEDSGVGIFDESDSNGGRSMLESAYLDPRFASGRVFAPQALGSLLAHCFHVPGMVEVAECLVQPDDREADAKMPWQVRVRPEFVGAKYVDLFMDSLQDPVHPVLLVGIYRTFDSKAVPGNRGFVWTNPPKDTILRATDMVYVLGDASFGQLAHSADLMPMGPPGLTNLMAFRPMRMT